MSLEHPESTENRLETLANKETSLDPEHFLVRPIHFHDDEKDKKRIDELDEFLSHTHEEEVPNEVHTEEKVAGVSKSDFTTSQIITNGVDFLPIIGSAKMLLEGFVGKQYGTNNKLTGNVRILHGASGLAFLILDATGIGAIASEAGKLGLKLSLRAVEKESLEKVFESKIIKEESTKLATRGNERIKRKEELQQM